MSGKAYEQNFGCSLFSAGAIDQCAILNGVSSAWNEKAGLNTDFCSLRLPY